MYALHEDVVDVGIPAERGDRRRLVTCGIVASFRISVPDQHHSHLRWCHRRDGIDRSWDPSVGQHHSQIEAPSQYYGSARVHRTPPARYTPGTRLAESDPEGDHVLYRGRESGREDIRRYIAPPALRDSVSCMLGGLDLAIDCLTHVYSCRLSRVTSSIIQPIFYTRKLDNDHLLQRPMLNLRSCTSGDTLISWSHHSVARLVVNDRDPPRYSMRSASHNSGIQQTTRRDIPI